MQEKCSCTTTVWHYFWNPHIFSFFKHFTAVLLLCSITTIKLRSLNPKSTKVSFFHQCSKMQLIPLKKFIIQTCFFQFLWFFRLKCWFQGLIIPRIHLILPNAYTQMCFDRNINGNWDYWSLHWWKKLALIV